MLASLAPLARFAPTVLAKVADALVPGAGEVVRKAHQWYLNKREASEKAEILKALQITEEKLNAFDRMFNILGKECGDLLDRVAALEAKGQDSADEIAREELRHPELQQRFDDLGLLVSILEHDVRRLDEKCASLGAFANELKAKQLTDTELADFRAFRQAKQLQAAGRFAESEPILLKLANTQPKSAAVAVAQAVAKYDDPAAFDDALRRAVKLRPNDDELKRLATAATVAVTRARTPAGVPGATTRRVPQVGDTLDGWLLEARLGGGGWGIVFRATNGEDTKAIKILRPDLSIDKGFVKAFREEAFKLNRLRHPNIVAVEPYGYCPDHHCHYFTMPLLPGLNLEQHLAKHGVPSAEVAMGWLTGLLDGLEHAHANGLIHRDVKPLNVMILPDGRAVLIDFGIAGLDSVAGHTQAMGKSSFFAPPEMHGLGEADTRADLFMLAATMFYALRFGQPLRDRHSGEYEADLVPELFRQAFDAALAPKRSKRPAGVGEMRKMLWKDIEAEFQNCLDSLHLEYNTFIWLKRNIARVSRWEQAAKEGCAAAIVLLADCHDYGVGMSQDHAGAMRWFRKAADIGNTTAMVRVGHLYACGLGVPADVAEAIWWYRKAADAGNTDAMVSMGFLSHYSSESQDFAEAMRWYRKAADAGNAQAMDEIGSLHYSGDGVPQDYAEAMRWFLRAADAGRAHAMLTIAGQYRDGVAVPQDKAEAMWWCRKAADAGSTSAMVHIGISYQYGDGISMPQDYAEAMRWYRKATDAGDELAFDSIGELYAGGLGVPQDYAEAMRYYRKAADAGSTIALVKIGELYKNGYGVTKNLRTAIEWFERAIAADALDVEKPLAQARAELGEQ